MSPLRPAPFEPRPMAMIGAWPDPSRPSARSRTRLRKHGLTGGILPVRRREAVALGERAYPPVLGIPGPVDLACTLFNTRQVESTVEAVAAKGIPAARAPAGGFIEAGPEGAGVIVADARVVRA